MNSAKSGLKMADEKRGLKSESPQLAVVKSAALADSSAKKIKPRAPDEDAELWLISYADLMTLLVGFFAMILSFSKVDPSEFEKMKKSATQMFGGEYKIPHEALLTNIREVLKKQELEDQVVINQDDKGIEVTFRGALFFDSGSASLKSQASDLLSKLIPILKENAQGYSLVIEGHTDDNPMKSPSFPSNWELSSFRSASVLRLLEDKGFEKSKLKAVGWADTRPIVPNRDPSGSPILENQGQNRRVVLKILKGDDIRD